MSERVTRVLCVADPRGSAESLGAALDSAADVDAIALVGELGGARGLRALIKPLMQRDLPAYWVPGPGDAPIADYLREAANIEVVAPLLRGVHGTLAITPDRHVLVAGLGGAVSDDPDAPRDEQDRLSYPRWEPEYRLKVIRELDEHELVLLFSTPPAHQGLGADGAEVLTELVATHRPRLAVCGGSQGIELIGRSLVVAPGPLADGHYAVADIHARTAQLEQLEAPARAS